MYRASLVCLIFLIHGGCTAQNTSNTNLDIFYLVQNNVKFSNSKPVLYSYGHKPPKSLVKAIFDANLFDNEEFKALSECLEDSTNSDNKLIEEEIAFSNSRLNLREGQQYMAIDFSKPCMISDSTYVVFKSQTAKVFGRTTKVSGVEVLQWVKYENDSWQLVKSKIIETY